MNYLTYEVRIPTWALFLALLVVGFIAFVLTQNSVMGELGRKAVESGVIPIICDHADPTLTHAECAVCNEALRRTFNDIADMDLGPNGVDVLMESIRKIAIAYAAQGAAV